MGDLLTAVRGTLHIYNSSLYDEAIEDWIGEAKAELIRSGVLSEVANDESNALVRAAIKAYAQREFTDDPVKKGKYDEAFQYRQDCLRKSKGYGYD